MGAGDLSWMFDTDSGRLNHWLALLANVAVLAGLAILIVEIRQTNELTKAQIEQSRTESFLGWRQELALNDHLAPLIVKVDQLYNELYGETYFHYAPVSLEEATARQQRTANILALPGAIGGLRGSNEHSLHYQYRTAGHPDRLSKADLHFG